MNYSFFLIPVLLIGLIPFSFAEVEHGKNYDKETISINSDGSKTIKHTFLNYDRIFNGDQWVDFLQSGNQIQTSLDTVILNADGSYTWVEKGITDKIIAKYADISDLNTWTYPNTLNNDTPDNVWNGTAFVSTKNKSGVGNLNYVYLLDGMAWKTQLEAKNLSALTTKVFGFDEIVDLERDTIKFGGVTRNLDNFDGITFDKEFLEANEGKVIDFLNGATFDFDKGFENLHSITVYDTGVNKSRLVFDYRTSEILLPGETLIVDPTFGPSSPSTEGRTYSNNPSSGTCVGRTFSGSDTIVDLVYGNNGYCVMPYFQYNTTSVPDGLGSVLSATFTYSIPTTTDIVIDCVLRELDTTATGSQTTYNESLSGTKISDVFTSCQSTGTGKTVAFNSAGLSDIYTKISSGINFYGLSVFTDAVTAPNGNKAVLGASPTLEITYSTAPVFEVNDIIIENIGDAFSITGNFTINSGMLINVTSIVHSVNGSAITTNSTGQNTTSYPQTINFGPFYYQQTSDSAHNHTVTVNVQSLHVSYSNSTSDIATREYDPDYFTALDPTQGLVNYTFISGNLLNVNRDTGGSGFNIECRYLSQSEAFFNDPSVGVWDNKSNVIFYVGDTEGYYYAECFNDGELFIIAIPQNYTNSLVPGLLIFDQLGGFFGAPSIILVIISILSLGTGRNYPIVMLIAAAVTGILLALELLTLDPGLVVAIIVMTGFGLFGIRKFY